MYVVNCFITGQKSPCLTQAYTTLAAAERRANKARNTFDRVEVKPGQLLYESVMDVLQHKPEYEAQEFGKRVLASMPELDTAELENRIAAVLAF